MFISKVFVLINNQLLSTANAKDSNTDYFCTDFCNEKKNGIFVLGEVFFSSDKFRFLNYLFLTGFFHHSNGSVVLSLILERYFTCDLS